MRKYLEKLSIYIFLLLLAYMPVYVFLSTWAGTSTGYLDAIKISKEVVLVFGFLLALSTTNLKTIKKISKDKLSWLILLYALISIFLALIKPTDQDAEGLAVVYNLRFLLFFVYAGLIAKKAGKNFTNKSVKIVITIGITVASLGILQVALLPNEALSHFGYSRQNGTPAVFYISDKTQFIERAFSTTKEPNSFGSYLIIILCLTALYLIIRWPKDRKLLSGSIIVIVLCLFLTYSRSAWIGAGVATVVLLLLLQRSLGLLIKYKSVIKYIIGIVVFLTISSIFVFKNTPIVQNLVFHVGDDAKVTSNSGRTYAVKYTINEVVDNPLGYGPGTAGPASFKNDIQGAVIPENYYLQLAYEVGIIGLGLFISICAVVAVRLYRLSKIDNLSKAMLASFIGIATTNLLVHIWFFEPVAYTWWGITGLVLYGFSVKAKKTKKAEITKKH